MATDTTNIQSETVNSSIANEGDVERVNLTQGATQVQLPEGQPIVRIQVTPGETIQLPFPADQMTARLDDGNGNLAVKVGDITVILQGYVAAVGEGDVNLLDVNGEQVDIAAVVAATDPNLDIETAAGPGAGDQGTGVDNNGGVFSPFDPRAGIGGLNAIGGLNPTALEYPLIQREFLVFEEDEADPIPLPEVVSITPGIILNEDDFGRGSTYGDEPSEEQVASRLMSFGEDDGGVPPGGYSILDRLAENGMDNAWCGSFGTHKEGNDPFDVDNYDKFDGKFDGVDSSKEPLSSTAIVEVNFQGSFPGTLTFDADGDGIDTGDSPVMQQLAAMGLTSHGHQLAYMLIPAIPESFPGANDGTGQMIVAYYLEQACNCYGESYRGEGSDLVPVIVFSISIGDDAANGNELNENGNNNIPVTYKIYGVIDHAEEGEGEAGEDILSLPIPFYVTNGGGTTEVPSGLGFQNVDDVPSLGEVKYGWCGDEPVGIYTANLTIGHDESKGDQSTGYDSDLQPNKGTDQYTDDVDGWLANVLTWQADNQLDDIAGGEASGEDTDLSYQQDILSQLSNEFLNNGNFCAEPLGVAKTYITVSFGADGKAKGNDQAGDTLFQHDNNKGDGTDNSEFNQDSNGNPIGDAAGTDKQAFELFMKDSNGEGAGDVLDKSATNWTISFVNPDGSVTTLTVYAFQLDANTIIGMASPSGFENGNEGGGGNDYSDTSRLLQGGEGNGYCGLDGEGDAVPVFMLRLDPQTGQLVFVQYHQINNPEGGNADHPDWNGSANDPIHLYDAEGNPLVYFQATDFDGDTVTAQLEVSVIDDAPKAKDDYADVDEGCTTVTGNLITGISYDGNFGNNTGKDTLSVDAGHKIVSMKHDGVTYTLELDEHGNPTGVVNIEGGPNDGTTTNLVDGKLTIQPTDLGGKLTVQMTETGSDPLGHYEYKSPSSVEHGDAVFKGFDPKSDNSNDSLNEWQNAFSGLNIEQSGAPGGGFDPGNDLAIKTVTVPGSAGNDPITYRGIGVKHGIDGAETDKNDGALRIGFAADQWRASLTLGALFDGFHFDSGKQEVVKWEIWDGNTKVGEGLIYGDRDGLVSLDINEGIKFDRIELIPQDNGAGNNGNNTDFLLVNVTTTKCDDTKTEEFDYLLQDADGDTSSATLHVNVEDLGPKAGYGVTCDSETVVKEAAINDGQDAGPDGGTNPGSPDEQANGQIQGFDLGPDSEGAAINIQLIDANDSDNNSSNGTVINDVGDLRSKGQPLTLVSDGGIPATITAYRQGDNVKVFSLVIDGNGNYEFKLFDQLDHPDTGGYGVETGSNDVINLKFEYTIVDGDACAPGTRDSQNDVAKGTITIAVQDDGPIICGVEYNYGHSAGIVDEDYLSKGIDGGPGDIGSYDNKASGQVIVNKGADQPVTFTFNETDGNAVYVKDQKDNTIALTDLNGNPVTMDVDNNFAANTAKLYGKANGETLFVITLNKTTGEFELELLKPVKHPFQDDGNGKNGTEISWEDDLALFNIDIKVTDFDGDWDLTKIEFVIDDDSPKIHDSHVSITLDEDVIPGANGNHPGGPGDTSPSYHQRTGSLGISFGADGKGSLTIALDDPSPKLSATGETLQWTQIGDTLIGHTGNTNDPAMTVKVEDDGDFTVTILKALKHADGNGENNLDLDFKVTATDKDGDKVTGEISVDIDDDSPLLSVKDYVDQNTGKGQGSAHHGGGYGYVDEDYLTKGNQDQGSSTDDAIGGTKSVALLNVLPGADGGSLSIDVLNIVIHGDNGSGLRRSDGAPIAMISTDGGKTVFGYADGIQDDAHKVFTIKIVGNTVEFELFQPLMQDSTSQNSNSGDGNIEGEVKFDIPVVLTDNDNDKASVTVQFLVDDDQPYLTGIVINGTVEEEALKNGNQELPDAEPDTNVASGSLGTLVGLGADQPGNWSIIAANLNQLPNNLKCGGLAVTFSIEGGDVVGKAGGVEVMRLDVNSDGSYTFTLSKQLDHPTGNGENNIAIDFGKVIKVTDSDNDSVNIGAGKFIINVVDDKPEVGQTLQWTVDEDGKWLAGGGSAPLDGGIPGGPGDTGDDWISFSGNLGVSFGQDGPAANPYTMSTTVSAFAPNGSPMALTSGGVPVTYAWAGNVLTASAGGLVVFTATVDQATGNVTIQLKGPLDHPNTSADENAGQVPGSEYEDTIRIELGFEAKDFDGDVVTGKVNMFVNDDTPDACCMDEAVVVEEPTGIVDVADVTVNPGNYQTQAVSDLVAITVTSPTGAASLNTNNNTTDTGFGITSPGGNGEARYNEINYLGDGVQTGDTVSEVMIFSLKNGAGEVGEGKYASSANVNFNVFFGNEGPVGDEVGSYRLYKDGVAVSDWISFEATSGSGDLNNYVINGPVGGFDEIRFIAAPGTVDPDGNTKGDSSDYNIEQITFDLFEGSTSTACGYLCGENGIQYGADGPGSVALVAGNPTGLTYGEAAIVESVSQDGKTLSGKVGETVIYTVTINAETGKYEFTLLKPIDGNQDHNLDFNYVVTDADGDSDTGCIKIVVEGGNEVPTLSATDGLVDEDFLTKGTNGVDGNQDLPAAALHDAGGSASATGSYTVDFKGEGGSVAFNVADGADTGVDTHDGTSIVWNAVSPTQLVGHAAGNESDQYFTMSLDTNTGQWTFTLLQAIKHAENSNEDQVDPVVSVGIIATDDNGGDTATATINVTIDDDMPVVGNDTKTVTESSGGATANVMFILDVSGSMGWSKDNDSAPPQGQPTRLQIAKDAIVATVTKYLDAVGGDMSAVRFQLVTFSGSAQVPNATWMDATSFLALLAGTGLGQNSTDYDDPLIKAEEAFGGAGSIPGAANVSYFLSDGEPNNGDTDDGYTQDGPTGGTDEDEGIGSNEEAQWVEFLTDNDIVSYAIGMGPGSTVNPGGPNNDELDPIAYNGATGTDLNAISVEDMDDLDTVLGDTISLPVTGNLFANDAPGADDWAAQAISKVTFNGQDYLPNANGVIVIVTDAGTLTVYGKDFNGKSAGDYSFQANDVNANTPLSFTYTAVDSDGDAVQGSLNITVENVNNAPTANNDGVYIGSENDDLILPIGSLLGNDTDPDFGDVISPVNVFNPVNGTVMLQNGNSEVRFIPTPGYSGPASFQYTMKDAAGLTSVATVNLMIEADNVAPVGKADHIYTNSFEELTIQSSWLLANDTDADADPLSVVDVNDNTSEFGFEDLGNLPSNFTLDIDGNSMENGEAGDYTYDLSDGTVEVTVAGGQVHYDTSGALEGGDATDDIMIGGGGDDTINGKGGADHLIGNDGDDTLVFDASDKLVDGGSGFDRAQTTGSFTFDSNPAGGAKFVSVEMLDIGDSNHNGNRTVTLNAADLLDNNAATVDVDQSGSGTNNITIDLFIVGDNTDGARDNVNLTGFTKVADLDNAGGNQDTFQFNDGTFGNHTYSLYTNGAGKFVAVEVGLDVITN
jgi:T1SS-143 domain-containing protein